MLVWSKQWWGQMVLGCSTRVGWQLRTVTKGQVTSGHPLSNKQKGGGGVRSRSWKKFYLKAIASGFLVACLFCSWDNFQTRGFPWWGGDEAEPCNKPEAPVWSSVRCVVPLSKGMMVKVAEEYGLSEVDWPGLKVRGVWLWAFSLVSEKIWCWNEHFHFCSKRIMAGLIKGCGGSNAAGMKEAHMKLGCEHKLRALKNGIQVL